MGSDYSMGWHREHVEQQKALGSGDRYPEILRPQQIDEVLKKY